MKKVLSLIILIFISTSCSTIKERNKKRSLQSETIRSLTAKNVTFGKCAKAADIFGHFKKERIRVELQLTLNEKGQIDKFQLDDKNYPNAFVDCLFQTVDLIIFPKLGANEVIQLNQPMIFSK